MNELDGPSVCILILNHNGRNLLQDCIHSIHANTDYPNYRIVLVDNNSSDGSVRYVNNHFPEVKIVKHSENFGFAEANNKAIKKIECDYVFLLNNDTEVNPGWLTPLIEKAESDDKTKVVSPKLIYENGDPQFLGDKIILDESRVPSFLNSLLTAIEKRYDYEKEVYRAIGAAMLINCDLFEEIGYLDEDYIYYMEEFDFCLRAKNAGYAIKYMPDSVVVHKSRTTAEKDPYYSFYLRRRSRVRFYILNFTTFRLLLQIPIEIATVFDSVVRGYTKWLFKGYYDSFKEFPDLIRLRRLRSQYHHTTNKFRLLSKRLVSSTECD